MVEKQHSMKEVHAGLAKNFPKIMQFLVLVIVLHRILIIEKKINISWRANWWYYDDNMVGTEKKLKLTLVKRRHKIAQIYITMVIRVTCL